MKKYNLIQPAFGITGLSLATGIVGTQFQSPGLIKASAASSKFIAPAVDISMGGYLINQLRNFKK